MLYCIVCQHVSSSSTRMFLWCDLNICALEHVKVTTAAVHLCVFAYYHVTLFGLSSYHLIFHPHIPFVYTRIRLRCLFWVTRCITMFCSSWNKVIHTYIHTAWSWQQLQIMVVLYGDLMRPRIHRYLRTGSAATKPTLLSPEPLCALYFSASVIPASNSQLDASNLPPPVAQAWLAA